MFLELWNIMYKWFWMFLSFGKSMVRFVSVPVNDLIRDYGNVVDGSLIDAILELNFLGSLSIIELMFAIGLPFLILFIIIKFLLDIVL